MIALKDLPAREQREILAARANNKKLANPLTGWERFVVTVAGR